MVRLTQEQVDTKKNFIRNYITASNAADGSKLDANANVSHKNIATLSAEINKDINIQINRALIKDNIAKRFGDELAEEYERQLERHEIYVHDETSLMPYCVSISLYPFLLNGLKDFGGETKPPKHLTSFNGGFINLVFAIASQFAGAVATVEWLMYFDYYARKEYGDDYLIKHKDTVTQELQSVVYALNQPAAARGFQSVFWNISIYDKPYFEAMFGNFKFPDMTAPKWETLDKLQRYFMDWFNKERSKALLTFPVVTAACLNDGNSYVDTEFRDFIAEEYSNGNAFFTFTSDSAHALSSCCFSEDQKCLTKDSNGVHLLPFKDYYNGKYREIKRNGTIFHNGSWVKGKAIKVPSRPMYKITTSNNKTFIMSDNHINVTIAGEKTTSQLTTNDKLLFNTRPLEGKAGLTYSEGFLVGAFLGDGSFGSRIKGTIYDINFSMGVDSYKEVMKQIDNVLGYGTACLSEPYNNVYPVRVSNKNLVAFIQKWTNWKEGTYAHNKEVNVDCLTESLAFRQGILDGWYHTDGGNSNRCYTTSEKLAENMEVLITSLGKVSIINVSDRTDEDVVIRGETFNRNYPLYCVRWYTPNNKRSMSGVYEIKNNSIYFDIKSIEPIEYASDSIYCFEMDNADEPYFTLPNGLITHNCRLKNDISDSVNDFSYSLGAGGVSTGSMNVITINYNRLVQDGRDIEEEVEKVHKYQLAFKDLFETYISAGMLPTYTAGYITIDKQYLTVGVNGVVEAAEFLGYTIDNNYEYKDWVSSQLKLISDLNKVNSKKYGVKFNTEFVPAENLGVKFAKWDRADGYIVPRDCYNSYLYKVEDDEVSIIDKFALHGRDTSQYLDGGSAYHCNLEGYPSEEGFKKLLDVAVKEGTDYFCFNIKVTGCDDCGHIDKRTLYKCSKCGSKNIWWATRVIGYLKKIKDFSSERQNEAKLRHYNKELK